jgi:hypothetical protein
VKIEKNYVYIVIVLLSTVKYRATVTMSVWRFCASIGGVNTPLHGYTKELPLLDTKQVGQTTEWMPLLQQENHSSALSELMCLLVTSGATEDPELSAKYPNGLIATISERFANGNHTRALTRVLNDTHGFSGLHILQHVIHARMACDDPRIVDWAFNNLAVVYVPLINQVLDGLIELSKTDIFNFVGVEQVIQCISDANSPSEILKFIHDVHVQLQYDDNISTELVESIIFLASHNEVKKLPHDKMAVLEQHLVVLVSQRADKVEQTMSEAIWRIANDPSPFEMMFDLLFVTSPNMEKCDMNTLTKFVSILRDPSACLPKTLFLKVVEWLSSMSIYPTEMMPQESLNEILEFICKFPAESAIVWIVHFIEVTGFSPLLLDEHAENAFQTIDMTNFPHLQLDENTERAVYAVTVV